MNKTQQIVWAINKVGDALDNLFTYLQSDYFQKNVNIYLPILKPIADPILTHKKKAEQPITDSIISTPLNAVAVQ